MSLFCVSLVSLCVNYGSCFLFLATWCVVVESVEQRKIIEMLPQGQCTLIDRGGTNALRCALMGSNVVVGAESLAQTFAQLDSAIVNVSTSC